MSSSTDVVRDLFDALNSRDVERMRAVMSDDFVEHEEIPVPPGDSDKARVAQMFSLMFSAFADFTMTIDDTITEGDKVVCRVRITGTHQGEFMGIPATGRAVEVPAVDILRVVDGRVVEHWGVMDNMAMMQQLGVAPA